MASCRTIEQRETFSSQILTVPVTADVSNKYACLQPSLPHAVGSQSMAPRYRAIAPRPVGLQDGPVDGQSPSTSSTDNSQDVVTADEVTGVAKKRTKRSATSKSLLLPRGTKRKISSYAPCNSNPAKVSNLPHLSPECVLWPATGNPAEVLKKFQALDATPLGKLLRATPDVTVGGATITWTSEGPNIRLATEYEKVVESPSQGPSSPSSPLPPSLPTPYLSLGPSPPLIQSSLPPCAHLNSALKPGGVGCGLEAVSLVAPAPVTPAPALANKDTKGVTRALFSPFIGSNLGASFLFTPVAGQMPRASATCQPVIETEEPGAFVGKLFGQPLVSSSLGSTSRPLVILNVADMEHTYGTQAEPAAVTDEKHQLLWANLAYTRTASAALIGGLESPAASLLAFPVPVSSITFQPQDGQPPCRGILWAFLKRVGGVEGQAGPRREAKEGEEGVEAKENPCQMMEVEGSPEAAPGTDKSKEDPVPNPLKQEMDVVAATRPPFLEPKPLPLTSRTPSSHHVFHPKAVRSIESCIKVESVAPVESTAVPMRGDYEGIHQLFEPVERWHTPVVLTDLKGQVRWVNTAYKLLTGQPRCLWLAETTGTIGQLSGARLTGEVTLTGAEPFLRLGEEAIAVTCMAEITWGGGATGGGAKSSALRLPAMATRLDSPGDSPRALGFVWHFDTAAAGLRLRDGS